MANKPLRSLKEYSQLVAELQNRPFVEHSTITVWSDSPYTAVAEGELFFTNGFRLRMREELDFDDQRITSYGYEVYRDAERLYWYDDFPHPNDSTLASTHPHHKHVPQISNEIVYRPLDSVLPTPICHRSSRKLRS
jgi:hypothetical protein